MINQEEYLYPETLIKQPLEYLHWRIIFRSNYLNFKIIFLSHLLLISFILFKLFARWSLVKMSVKINSVLPGIEYWVHLLQMQMINISQSWLFRSNLFKGFLSQIISQLFLNFQMTKIQNYHVVIVSVTIASRSSSQNGFTKTVVFQSMSLSMVQNCCYFLCTWMKGGFVNFSDSSTGCSELFSDIGDSPVNQILMPRPQKTFLLDLTATSAYFYLFCFTRTNGSKGQRRKGRGKKFLVRDSEAQKPR